MTSWLKALEPKVKTAEGRKAFDGFIHGMEKKQFPYTLCITNLLLHGIDSPDIRHGNSLGKNILDYTEEDKFDVVLVNPLYMEKLGSGSMKQTELSVSVVKSLLFPLPPLAGQKRVVARLEALLPLCETLTR